MSTGDHFGYYIYNSDDGSPYVVKLSAIVAAQGNFAATTNPLGSTSAVWAYGAHNMRHVTGVGAGGKRARLPIAQPGGSLYVGGGTFTTGAGTFQVLGAEGERRVATNIR